MNYFAVPFVKRASVFELLLKTGYLNVKIMCNKSVCFSVNLLVTKIFYLCPLQSFSNHFFLLLFQRCRYYELLQLLIAIINDQLLKAVCFYHLEPIKVQDPQHFPLSKMPRLQTNALSIKASHPELLYLSNFVYFTNEPRKQPRVQSLAQSVSPPGGFLRIQIGRDSSIVLKRY